MEDEKKAELPLPKTIGGYEIVGRLGQGGFVTAYRARKAGGTFVVRVLRKDTDMPEAEVHFQNEVDVLQMPALASAKQIARYIEHGEDPVEGLFIVTEFVEGPSLQELMPDHGMEEDEALRIAITICKALSELAQAEVVHEDIKPNNIVMKRLPGGLWNAYIIDFNTASKSGRPRPQYTDKGGAVAVIGTPRFMAPEQARGEPLDDRTDVFALGCMLCMMLTGECIATTDDQKETVMLRGGMKVLPARPDRIREEVWAVLKEALHPFIERRPQASLMEQLLLSLVLHEGPRERSEKEAPPTRTITQEPTTEKPHKKTGNVPRYFQLMGVTGILMACIAGILLRRRSETTAHEERSTNVVTTIETQVETSTPQHTPRAIQQSPQPPPHPTTPRIEGPRRSHRRPSTSTRADPLPQVVGARRSDDGRGYTIPGPSHWNDAEVAGSRSATCAGLRHAGMEHATGPTAIRFHAFCNGY